MPDKGLQFGYNFAMQATRLYFLGFLTLFLELALIRYLSGNVWNMGYFPNLVLIAVFVGMGCGFLFHRLSNDVLSRYLFAFSVPLLLALVLLVHFERPVVPGFHQNFGRVGEEVYLTSIPKAAENPSLLPLLILFLILVLLFVLISQRTAKFFSTFAPLRAYGLDIAGSCTGIICFVIFSWFQLPPVVWFLILIIPFLILLETHVISKIATVIMLIAVAATAYKQDATFALNRKFAGTHVVKWSPYQKVEFIHGASVSKRIFVNGLEHQLLLSETRLMQSFYRIPYLERAGHSQDPPYQKVLIIGAGSGNDVAMAILQNAKQIDAVEIDPVIAEIGKNYHSLQPYSDPRVRLIIDDGRSYLNNTHERYDLIIFALTDSLIKVSSLSQLRLENYLFTQESVRKAYSVLTDRGSLYFYNYYRFPWIMEKLQTLIFHATGKFPHTITTKADFAMYGVNRYYRGANVVSIQSGIEAPTDNWPFLYLEKRTIPALYRNMILIMFAGVGVLALFLQKLGTHFSNDTQLQTPWLKAAFLLMGIAFLLLETKSVIQFSLLFGTTWLNNSLVFIAILLLVLAANGTAQLIKDNRVLWIAYVLLIASSLITVFYPLGNLLQLESKLLRFIFASLITFAPIYFANLIFSLTFRDQPAAEILFGWNLIGATLGGLLEYTSMALGYSALAILVALCYSAAAICFMAPRRAIAVSNVVS
jgi:spermidine synthase